MAWFDHRRTAVSLYPGLREPPGGSTTGAGEIPIRMLSDDEISPFYDAVIESTEEAILNAMLAAETMTGRDGNTVHALEPELLVEVLRQS